MFFQASKQIKFCSLILKDCNLFQFDWKKIMMQNFRKYQNMQKLLQGLELNFKKFRI